MEIHFEGNWKWLVLKLDTSEWVRDKLKETRKVIEGLWKEIWGDFIYG